MYELGEKVLFLHLARARRGEFGARFDYEIYMGCRSFDGQPHVGTPSGVIRCRTVRQRSAQDRWDTESVLSIKALRRLQKRSVTEMSTSAWISLRLEVTGVRIRRILTHLSSPRRMRLAREMFESAIRTGIG